MPLTYEERDASHPRRVLLDLSSLCKGAGPSEKERQREREKGCELKVKIIVGVMCSVLVFNVKAVTG